MEVPLRRRQRRRLPRPLHRLPREDGAGAQLRRAQIRRRLGVHGGVLVPQLHRPLDRRVGLGGARRRVAGAVHRHVGGRRAENRAAAVAEHRREGGEEGLEPVLQYPVLESEFLGQRVDAGRRGGEAAEDVPQGLVGGGDIHLRSVSPSPVRGDGGGAAGPVGVGVWISRRGGGDDRREVAKGVDRDRGGPIRHRPLRGTAQQLCLSGAGHGGDRSFTQILRYEIENLRDAVDRDPGPGGGDPWGLIRGFHGHNLLRQLPLQPRDAPGVRILHMAPPQVPHHEETVQGPPRHAGACDHVLGALRVLDLRHGHWDQDRLLDHRLVDGLWRRLVLPHEPLEEEEGFCLQPCWRLWTLSSTSISTRTSRTRLRIFFLFWGEIVIRCDLFLNFPVRYLIFV